MNIWTRQKAAKWKTTNLAVWNSGSRLPIGLTLGTLLWALPILADPPAAPATPSRTLVLQNVVPGDILKALHWDQATRLPEGVTQISARPETNSLSVTATPAGFAQVQQIVKMRDVAPRHVQINYALAQATAADLKATGINFDVIPLPAPLFSPGSDMGYAAGDAVAQFLQTLRKRGAIADGPSVITSDNVDATIHLSGEQPLPALPDLESFTFAATPRVNGDDIITLALHPQATWRVAGKTKPDGMPATTSNGFQTTCAVRNRETLVFTNIFAGAAGDGGSHLLLFVTPTVVPVKNGAPPKK